MQPVPLPSPVHYGADAHGLVCGYRFEPGGAGQALDAEQALAWLQHGPQAGGFIWLHFNLAHAAAEAWLRAHAHLPDGYFEALHEGPRSSRIERDGEALTAVINDLTFDFAFEPTDVATLWLGARGGVVVTARRHPLRAVDRLRSAVRAGEALASPVDLLAHLLGDRADELQRTVRRGTERVDDIEDELLAGRAGPRGAGHGQELSRLRRLMVRLQRLLAPEPSALLRLLTSPPAWVGADDVQRLRHASEEFAAVLRDIGALQERIKLLQEEALARVADENNRSLFVLTVVTVLALPINLVAGLLGMNVGGIPFADHPHGFWMVVALIVVFTGLATVLAVRRLAPRR